MNACLWPGKNLIMQQYHDNEWCVPSHDDSYIFEMLSLEGAQVLKITLQLRAVKSRSENDWDKVS